MSTASKSPPRRGLRAMAVAAAPVAALYGLAILPASAQSSVTNLGILSGGVTGYAYRVNDDGSVAVGSSNVTGAIEHAFRWTSAGMADIGTLGGTKSAAFGVNSDGSVVVGYANTTGNGAEHAFRWTSAGGMVDLGTLPGGIHAYAYDVNSDGSVVVGNSGTFGGYHAFRWTNAGGMVDLGTLGGSISSAYGVSSDGSVVVGNSDIAGGGAHAFRWTSAGGMANLGTLGGSTSNAWGVNGDGAVVVGDSGTTSSGSHAFRWTSAGMADLGTLGGTNSMARDVSGDGSVVVGSSDITGGGSHAFRWTNATGMKDLNTLLTTAGVNMTGITLTQGYGVSGNGQFIVGQGDFSGLTRPYLARYNEGAPAGLTTRDAVQQSVNGLAGAHAGLMAQQHGFAAPLLGSDKPMGLGSEAGVFAALGSAEAGGHARYSNGKGWSLLGGIDYARESYASADLKNSFVGALALQYIYDSASWWRPFAEVGGWLAPGASLAFSRDYLNGAGTTTGTGSTKGDLSYVYGRAGLLLARMRSSQIAVSGELGREQLRLAAYTEQDSASNPFPAAVSSGTDTMDVAKARMQLSHNFTPRVDGTLWAAAAHGFNRSSGLTATVLGFGTLTPAALDPLNWAEYGARLGYKVTEATTLDVFANGVSGRQEIGTKVHVGAGMRMRF